MAARHVAAVVALILMLLSTGCSRQSQLDEEIMIAFAEQNIELVAQESCEYNKLNKRKPLCFDYLDGVLLLFTYQNKAQVDQALKEFDQDEYNRVIPQIFSSDRAVLMYYTREERTDPYENRDGALVNVEKSLNDL